MKLMIPTPKTNPKVWLAAYWYPLADAWPKGYTAYEANPIKTDDWGTRKMPAIAETTINIISD